MKIGITASILLHIIILNTLPLVRLTGREYQTQPTSVTYLGILSDDDFLTTSRKKTASETVSPTLFFSDAGAGEKIPAPEAPSETELEFIPEPEPDEKSLEPYLEGGVRKSLHEIMEAYEKETPPVSENQEIEDAD